MSRYKTYPDPRQAVKQDDSIYEPRIDWEPRGEPYAHMVLRIHRENQRLINACERHGWFDPVYPWFYSQLEEPTGCLGTYDDMTGEYDCEYQTSLICEECKYGLGRKDPDAKCNRV